MSTNSKDREARNWRESLVKLAKALGAILGVPLALFVITTGIVSQPLIALAVALITAVLASALVVCYGWTGITEMIVAWLALTVVVLAGFVIWPKTMTVEGTILDTAGAPTSYEKVVLIDVDGVHRETSTDAEGCYQFRRVPSGPYRVRAKGHEVGGGAGGILPARVVYTDLIIPRPTPTFTPTATPTTTPTPTFTPTATPTTTPTPTLPPEPDAVIVAPVNLRRGPGTVYDIISTLSPGQVLTVTGRITDTTWLQVSTDQMQEGWVVNWADLVTLNLPTDRIPIVLTPPLPPACQITEPADGDENLGYENMVRVTCSYVPDSLYVWVLVYSHHDHNYYPQPGSIRSGSGDHEGMAYLGRPTEGIGDEFDIIIALADEDASRILQSAARNYIGWPDFPDGVEEKDRITVRRGQGCLITEPTDGDRDLGWENDVRAQCFGVPTSLYVWVLVYSHYDSRYYPQVGHIGIGSGDHEGKAYLGIEGTGDGRGIGHEYDIIIALANEAANTELQSAATNYIGWPVLPDGVEAEDSITVRRGH